jgi:UDP-N-acetylmuramate dehydrogenase
VTILDRPALAPLTTLRLGGTALAEIRLYNESDCEHLSDALAHTGGYPHILGGGSNLLIHDGDLPITVLRPLFDSYQKDGSLAEPELLGPDPEALENRMLIRAGAGISVPRLLAWCVRKGLAGLEGLIGVPGKLGGAIAMNAGAYGCSTVPLLYSLTVYTPEKGLHTLHTGDWIASYRTFSLTSPCAWYMVVSAVLSLRVTSPELLRSAMLDNFHKKISTQPVHAHTAGCIFQNPPGNSAGRLLDASGMKGQRCGALYFSSLHANFLVHDTQCGIPGRTEDALYLIAKAQRAVQERFDIRLHCEVKEWSCPS